MHIAVASSADTPFAEKVGRKAGEKGESSRVPMTDPWGWYIYLHFFVDFYGKLVAINIPFFHGFVMGSVVVFFFLDESIPHLGSSCHFCFWGGAYLPKILEDER